jgi:hypothetical protein
VWFTGSLKHEWGVLIIKILKSKWGTERFFGLFGAKLHVSKGDLSRIFNPVESWTSKYVYVNIIRIGTPSWLARTAMHDAGSSTDKGGINFV